MSGVYWGLMGLHLLGRLPMLDGGEVVDWVLRCQRPCGGFGGSERHDPHLLYTLSALQILALYDELHRVDADVVARCTCGGVEWAGGGGGGPYARSYDATPASTPTCCSLMTHLPSFLVPDCMHADVASLQQPDGSFWGDEWGETDSRFSYCALSCLWLLGRLHAVDVPAAAWYVAACKNFDGGFGCTPGACLAYLASGDRGQACLHLTAVYVIPPDAPPGPALVDRLVLWAAWLAALQATSPTQGRCSRAWRHWTSRGGWTSWTQTCCAGGQSASQPANGGGGGRGGMGGAWEAGSVQLNGIQLLQPKRQPHAPDKPSPSPHVPCSGSVSDRPRAAV